MGRLDLELVNGQIVNYRHRLIEIEAAIQPDSTVDELVRQVLAPYKNELSGVVGETATALNRGTIMESTMDNFLLQSLLENTGAQLAFSNGWRYSAPIVPGKIILNDLYNIIPMNPPVSTVELSVRNLKQCWRRISKGRFHAIHFSRWEAMSSAVLVLMSTSR